MSVISQDMHLGKCSAALHGILAFVQKIREGSRLHGLLIAMGSFETPARCNDDPALNGSRRARIIVIVVKPSDSRAWFINGVGFDTAATAKVPCCAEANRTEHYGKRVDAFGCLYIYIYMFLYATAPPHLSQKKQSQTARMLYRPQYNLQKPTNLLEPVRPPGVQRSC